MNTFFMKQGDTAPSLQATCKRGDGPVDLTDATAIRFHASNGVDGAAFIVTAASGLVQYDWQSDDTGTAGVFELEIEVTWSDGSVETFPNTDTNPTLVIAEAIA
jgi:hypothetical protein